MSLLAPCESSKQSSVSIGELNGQVSRRSDFHVKKRFSQPTEPPLTTANFLQLLFLSKSIIDTPRTDVPGQFFAAAFEKHKIATAASARSSLFFQKLAKSDQTSSILQIDKTLLEKNFLEKRGQKMVGTTPTTSRPKPIIFCLLSVPKFVPGSYKTQRAKEKSSF